MGTGESMPDISKLPELAYIFNVNIDDILGSSGQVRIIEKVIAGKTADLLSDYNISVGDIIKTAPLLKPAQAHELFVECAEDFNIGELCEIAPYISREALDNPGGRQTS